MKCTECKLHSAASHACIMGQGKQTARVMFIQDCPDEGDDHAGVPFSGKSCTAVKTALSSRGINPVNDVYFTSMVKCTCEDKEVPLDCVAACTPILEAEIEVIDPDIIVPMGNRSLKYCLGRVGLTKVRGNAQEVEIMGRTRIVLPTMHPRMVLKKPAYKDQILRDMDTLKELFTNGMTQVTDVDYRYLETIEDVTTELTRMKREAKRIVFDLETTGKSSFMDYSKIVCISLTDKPRYGVVIPLYKHDSPFSLSETGYIVKLLRWVLEDPSIPKSAHNGKFDIEWLKAWLDINVANFDFDTIFGHYIAISEEQGTQGLKSQAWEFTDMGGYDNELDEFTAKLSNGEGAASKFNYDRVPWNILRTYAAADVDCCYRLVNIYKPMIDGNDMWKTLMEDILMPASYALRDIEINGMRIDMDLAQQYSDEYDAEVRRIVSRLETYPEVLAMEREKRQLALERERIKLIPPKDRTPEEKKKFGELKKYENYKFNWNSIYQLRELLYDRLQLVTTVTTDKGEPSTNEEAMEEIKDQHEIPTLLLELRKVTTLNNMFIKKLPAMRDGKDIIHSSFNLTGTVTGRLSSENPNFQQLPRKSEENPLLFQYHHEPKALFVSRFGSEGCILNADYAALEMRIAAIISDDKKMTQAFLSGSDIHKANASYIWRIPIEEVTKDLRTKAKSLGFGIIYGKSGITFAKELYYDPSGTVPGKTDDWDEAKREGFDLVEHFLGTFDGLGRWLERTKKFAYKHGYVETMFGRRRRLPDLHSRVSGLKSNAERQAINAPIQGTGSDLTMLSVIQINNWLKKNRLRSLIVATVHDSIVLDVYLPELSVVGPMVKRIMEHVHEPYIDTEVPILAELEMGINYGATFEVAAEDCQKMTTISDFNCWVHDQSLVKYRKEIDFFKKHNWNKQQVLQYLEQYHRPIRELVNYLEQTFEGGV